MVFRRMVRRVKGPRNDRCYKCGKRIEVGEEYWVRRWKRSEKGSSEPMCVSCYEMMFVVC